jgi:DNA polymerase III delta prime subunit
MLFLLSCKSPDNLLETIISRCTTISIPLKEEFLPEGIDIAKEIALAIVDINEYTLLRATYRLNKKDVARSVLPPLKGIIRDCLVLSVGGEVQGNIDIPKKIIRKLTREKLLDILNILDSAQKMLEGNVNLALLSTWLCTEFRRITWQK